MPHENNTNLPVVLVGIVSFGPKFGICESDKGTVLATSTQMEEDYRPGVYTRVRPYIDWIANNTWIEREVLTGEVVKTTKRYPTPRPTPRPNRTSAVPHPKRNWLQPWLQKLCDYIQGVVSSIIQ